MRKVSDKSCTENQNTHFMSNNSFFFPENRADYEIMWKNTVELERPQMKIWRIRTACRIPMATNTHSEYVILLFHGNNRYTTRPSMLRYTYIASLVFLLISGEDTYRRAGENLRLRCCLIQISGHSYVHIHKKVACLGSEPRYSATGQTFFSILA